MKKLSILLVLIALVTVGCFKKQISPVKNCMNTTYLFVVKTSLVVVETNNDIVVGIQQFNIKDAIAGPAESTGRTFNFISMDNNKTIDKIEMITATGETKTVIINDHTSFTQLTEFMNPYFLINRKE